jgi:hypothetical protein
MFHGITGDVRRALTLTNMGIALDPKSTPPHMESLNASRDLGHDEDVLAQARAIAGLRQEDNVASWRTGPGYPYVQQLAAINRASETGDFGNLSGLPCLVYCSPASSALLHAKAFARLHDAANATEEISRAQSLGTPGGEGIAWNPDASFAMAQYFTHAAREDWKAAAIDAHHVADRLLSDKSYGARLQSLRIQTLVLPLLAQALPSPWNNDIAKFLPSGLGAALFRVRPDTDLLSPGVALVVAIAWLVVAYTIATVLITRRDA